MSEPDPSPARVSAALAEVSRLHRALMRRVQADADCEPTGIDCNARGGAALCSCSLQAKAEADEPYA
jgi:hypothetical protein